MLLDIFILLLSLVLLVVSSDQFVTGAIFVSNKFKLPEIVIGGIIVAIGTSAPELAINSIASIKNEHNIVVSNIIGSNIVNICLGIGLSLFLIQINFSKRSTRSIYLVGLSGCFVFLIGYLFSESEGMVHLPFYIGFPLIILFSSYLLFMSRQGGDDESLSEDDTTYGVLRLVGGCVALLLFADLAVDSAVSLAEKMNVSDVIIGATLIAAGGSLPEVAACLSAAKKKKPSIIVGTIGGSQIFNLFGIFGTSLLIGDMEYSSSLTIDVIFLVIVTLSLLIMSYLQPGGLNKKSGFVFCFIYLLYMLHLYLIA